MRLGMGMRTGMRTGMRRMQDTRMTVISVSIASVVDDQVLQHLLPGSFVVSDVEEEGDGRQNRLDQSVSDGGDLERLAERIRKTYAGRMGRTRDFVGDYESLQPSTEDPELWMLRTKVRTVVMHRFHR
jgi:hypothetical protein